MTIAVSVVIAFVAALASALVLTPWVMRLAARVGAIDLPNQRKVHKTPTPRMGGVAVFLSLAVGLGVLAILKPTLLTSTWLAGWDGLLLFVALVSVVALGISDDIKNLKPLHKFAGQLVLALIVYFSGFGISIDRTVFAGTVFSLGVFDLPLTLLWIVGVTNALNLIDGLDGLASGVAMIAALTMAPIAFLQGDIATAVVTILLSGALLGFLRYNFNPAKIFLGDSGSLFLGFILSILALKSSTKASTGFAILIPILALGLPIMDTFLSMARRFLNSFLPENAGARKLKDTLKFIFQPDKGHVHHRLISQGFTTRKAVVALYAFSSILGIGAFAITFASSQTASLILLGVGLVVFVGVRQLRYREMAVLNNGVLLPLYDKPIMNRESMQGFFDLGFILLSFGLASALVDGQNLPNTGGEEFLRRIALIGLLQLGVFILAGHQKRTYQFFGLGDALRTVKTILLAVGVSGVGLWAMSKEFRYQDWMILVDDLFFLTAMTIGMSLSYRVLHFLTSKQRVGAKGVLLYGADNTGSLVLDRVMSTNLENWKPVGFLDDNPALEGRFLNGFPIFGGHWSLPKVLRENRISEIIICSEEIQEEALRRVEEIAKESNVRLKRIRILYEDYRPDETKHAPKPILVQHEEEANASKTNVPVGRRVDRWPQGVPMNINPSAPQT